MKKHTRTLEPKGNVNSVELWGGIECTINRVGDVFKDQLELSGHYQRGVSDIRAIASLGIKALRYPVLWEKHEPLKDQELNFSFVEGQLAELQRQNIDPIVGLVHHGSGPAFTHLLDPGFPEALASYAGSVAAHFPWVNCYTPVNEPLTTARFSGLYGFWFPHHNDDVSFAKMLINELKATVLSMQAIRKINPGARLIQTEDLAKTYSTSSLSFQATFENERRWITFDLLCGKLVPGMLMYDYLIRLGIPNETLQFFIDNPCPPDVMGMNYYITSERYLDENLVRYPACTHGGNELQQYADVEAIRVQHKEPWGLKVLMREAWQRYGIPLAITECHLHCTREEQLRWFSESWQAVQELKNEAIDVRALTAWSLLGSFGWDRLLTSDLMNYESAVFDIRSGMLRETALAHILRKAAAGEIPTHPMSNVRGWWHRTKEIAVEIANVENLDSCISYNGHRPILIIGRNGTLARGFAKIATARHIPFFTAGRNEVDITNPSSLESLIKKINPWAIINTAGLVNIDLAETDQENCFALNTAAAVLMATACVKHGLQFMTFSSDQVFDGTKKSPYTEDDPVHPINAYGQSKAMMEKAVMAIDPGTCIVRTSAFFGPWDEANFATQLIQSLKKKNEFKAAGDVFVSPTYVPDLVHHCLDILIDQESGIWHLANEAVISWSRFAKEISKRAGLSSSSVKTVPSSNMGWTAARPAHVFLATKKGIKLPPLHDAINRYFIDSEILVGKINV